MTLSRMTLALASTNRGTLSALRDALDALPVEVLPGHNLVDAPMSALDTDTSFEDKALRKARLLAGTAMVLAVGEASGLEVDALGGEPGIRSARFAGWGATDAENNAELLRRLTEVDQADRSARFVCSLALVDPWSDDEPLVITCRCAGRIAHKPGDSGGFGYEPLFIVDEFGKTMAQLNEEERQRVSALSQAIRQLVPALEELLNERLRGAYI